MLFLLPVLSYSTADIELQISEIVSFDIVSAIVRWSKEPANGETLYVLLSRSGYTDDLKNVANARDDVRLFGLFDLLSANMNA
jgi:hypothetical protein